MKAPSSNNLTLAFKEHFYATTGIKIDFRVHAYLSNNHGLTPIFDYELAKKIVASLYQWANDYVVDNKESYPDFGGFSYEMYMALDGLRVGKLSVLVNHVAEELCGHYAPS